MIRDKKNLCIFAHYFTEDYFPLYVQYYLNELSNHFDMIILVTNDRPINKKFKLNAKVQIRKVKNEGYDFGMFYKIFHGIDFDEYCQIACINDSNILFGRLNFLFDWSKNHQVDFWGLVDSNETPWFSKHKSSYHIQSHFIVFNQKAIDVLLSYLAQSNYEKLILEENSKILRQKVINEWEIGLTQFFIQRGLVCKSFIDSFDIGLANGTLKPKNVIHKYYAELISNGVPLIKKRLIMEKGWRTWFKYKSKWSRLIQKHGDKNWEIDDIISELNTIRNQKNIRLLGNFESKIRKLISKKSA